MLILNKYQIIEHITCGNFATLYKVSYNNSLYALKEDSNKELLIHEANVYKELRNIKFVSKLYDFFTKDNFCYILIDYFDENLYNYKNRVYNSENYELKIIDIFTILFDTIKKIHEVGYVHRDLKPLNICLKKTVPYFIDFGFSKKIIENNKHISEKKIHSIIGSYSFISNNVKNNIEPTRRDDIESLLYILLFMFLDKNKENNFVGFDIQLEYINNMVIKLYKFQLESFKKILIYVKKMKYAQEPNYYYIIKKLFI